MPASLNSTPSFNCRQPLSPASSAAAGTTGLDPSATQLNIGLINNMPDGALEATERQFLSLLNAASGSIHVHLSLYSLPGVSRSGAAANRVQTHYSSVENLWGTKLDGLIVTGKEPLTQNLADEPYWDHFTQVVDWARDNTYSTVWSCLAAHAAVLHSDGIGRVKSPTKNSGIFECRRVANHALTAGAPSGFRLPHSRWNGLQEEALAARGYRILTRTASADVDTFVKQHKSLFVFFQGHPEYESDTLLLEYRRDIGRYIKGDIAEYPSMPQNYFDHETVIALAAFQEEAAFIPRRLLSEMVSNLLSTINIQCTWRSTATHIYKNWLEYIYTQKQIEKLSGRITAKEPFSNESTLVAIAAAQASQVNTYAGTRKGPATQASARHQAILVR